MTVKNLFLGFVAVILTVCLIGLLILATNEDALAKVHKTINTLNAINVSTEDTYKKKMDILNIHTAKASEVNENKSNSFNEQECQVIADRYADKHINDNYGLERISKTNHGYNYVYSNDNSTSKQHVSISNQGIITK
ncbi:TPA: hypothetical protein PJA23_000400 [Staphylococcus aureus]|nr:hypothetical protein [Staphylococcus aureus]